MTLLHNYCRVGICTGRRRHSMQCAFRDGPCPVGTCAYHRFLASAQSHGFDAADLPFPEMRRCLSVYPPNLRTGRSVTQAVSLRKAGNLVVSAAAHDMSAVAVAQLCGGGGGSGAAARRRRTPPPPPPPPQ